MLHQSIKELLKKYADVDDSVVRELVRTTSESNMIMRFCGKDGSLSTTKRRASYMSNKLYRGKASGVHY